MTLLKLLTDRLPPILKEYNINTDVHIEPSYPRDLTNMFKPSIIVRRVDTERYKLGMGNVLGQLFEKNIYSDMTGIMHDIMIQFDIIANGNTHNLLLTSILGENIFEDIIINDGGKIQLYDFTKDINSPSEMGVITVRGVPNVTYIQDGTLKPSLNNDYISATRLTFTIIQEIKPNQDYVDLDRWIKIKQTINVI